MGERGAYFKDEGMQIAMDGFKFVLHGCAYPPAPWMGEKGGLLQG